MIIRRLKKQIKELNNIADEYASTIVSKVAYINELESKIEERDTLIKDLMFEKKNLESTLDFIKNNLTPKKREKLGL